MDHHLFENADCIVLTHDLLASKVFNFENFWGMTLILHFGGLNVGA